MPLSHVLHYALPDSIENYEARLAECDRLNRRGASIVFVDDPDTPLIAEIEERTGGSVTRLEPLAKPERSREPRGGDGRRGGRGGQRGPARSEQREGNRVDSSAADDARGNVAPQSEPEKGPRKTLGGRHRPRNRSRRMW